MRYQRPLNRPEPESPPTLVSKGGRLYSWKEIAAYLGHGVRTVQRWETEGLPIHRHPHAKRDSVYAYPAELDAWWTSHRSKPEPEDSAEASSGMKVHLVPVTVQDNNRTSRRQIALPGLVLTTLALASWWLVARAPVHPRSDGSRLTLLISSPEWTVDPVISPDAKMVAYVTERHGQMDLFISSTGGGEGIQLTNDLASEGSPRFSPDGQYIAFTRQGSGSPAGEICVVSAVGGVVTRVRADAAEPVWSPDGRRIAFVSRVPGGADTLATVAADGTDFRPVAVSDATYPFFRRPAWSPDGMQLAVQRSTGGVASELWLVPLSGDSPRRLTNDPPGIFSNNPIFTPDGNGLIHQSNRGGARNLWMLPLDGGAAKRLTTGSGPDESPSVARNGTIVFGSSHERCALTLHDLATGRTREVLTHSSFIWAPAFSPDGRELAFSRAEVDGSWHIWIVPAKGGSSKRLTSGDIPEVYPRFSPDGSFILYHTWHASAGRIWRVPRTGGPPVAVTPVRDEDDNYGDVSPDGQWIAFARTEKQVTRVYTARLDGGKVRRLIDGPSTLPRWSPDGHWIAYSPSRSFNGGVFVAGADGTGARRLTERGSFPVWSRDGKSVGYIDVGPDGVQRILSVPLAGGVSKTLGTMQFKAANNPFDISPDGRLLASSGVVSLSSEIWRLELSD